MVFSSRVHTLLCTICSQVTHLKLSRNSWPRAGCQFSERTNYFFVGPPAFMPQRGNTGYKARLSSCPHHDGRNPQHDRRGM
jgi:hypothetical protein